MFIYYIYEPSRGEASRVFCIIYTVIFMLLVSRSVFAFLINDSIPFDSFRFSSDVAWAGHGPKLYVYIMHIYLSN